MELKEFKGFEAMAWCGVSFVAGFYMAIANTLLRWFVAVVYIAGLGIMIAKKRNKY